MQTNPAANEPLNPALERQVNLLRQVAAGWCALVGLTVLVAGWGFHVNALKTILAGAPYMRVNAAIGLIVLGAALWPQRRGRHFVAAAGGLVALLSVLTVIEYAFGVNLRIDELAMRDSSPPIPGWPPGRVAFTTAVCFALLGTGLALSALRRAISTTQWLALLAAGISMAGLFGYLYGVPNTYGLACYMSMPVHVALTFLVASIALLFANPKHGVMRNIMSSGPGGVISRRLVPAAILVPPLLGWFRWQGQRLGYYDTAFGLSLFAAANVIVFTAVIWFTSRMLNRSDTHRQEARRDLRASEGRFRALFESTPDAMIITDQVGGMVLVNAQAEALFGYSREELLGEPIEMLVPHEVREGHRDRRAAFAGAPHIRQMCAGPADIRGIRKDGGVFSADVSLNSIRTPDGLWLVCTVRDLTAQRLSETALRESEARFRQLADAMPQIVWTANPNGKVDYHNQRWCDYTGLTREESLSLGWQPVLHPDDLASCMERRTRAIAAGEPYEVEYRLHRAEDGVYRWHLGRAVPVRNADGGVAHWFGTCTDIDDYKRAEQEVRLAWLEIKSLNLTLEGRVRESTLQLRNSEELFRGMVEGVKEYAILMLDLQGCVTSWTDSAERLKGYCAAEILGKSFACFYDAADIACGHPEDALRAAALNGRFEEQGWRIRKDGSRFWAEILITAMRDETGQLRGYSKITRDITDRMQSDEQMRQSEAKFRALLESAPDAVVIADGEGTIVLVNAQAERLFGYGRQEMVGQAVEMLIPAGARAGHPEHREGFRQANCPRKMGIGMDLNGLRKNGEEFPIEVGLSPIETPQGSWVAAAVRDTGERKLVERQLVIARQVAEEANRAKSAFLAAMSHEIRTPMNAILGMSELLAESDLNNAQKQYVQIFRRAGASLLNLIDDILDFSKIEAGQLNLEHTEFPLRELLDQVVELVTPKARAKGIALVSRSNAKVSNWFAGDPTRLRQVLINLVGNAIKFTETGVVVLAVQESPAESPAGSPAPLEFSISDTGIGIPAEQLGTIFEDFKQGDSSITRKFGGSGLGLAISRGIVEKMGGTISVSSEIGKGSTFRFSVPLQPVPAPREEVQKEARGLHGHRVAIVDSNTTNRLFLRETLGGWGLETIEFASLDEALADLAGRPHAQCPYSVLIVDSRVDRRVAGAAAPKNGFETAAGIRTVFPNLPVIMLASEDRPCDAARCRESGFSGYAVRPVSRAALLQLVSKALDGSLGAVTAPAERREPAGPSAPAQVKPLRILLAEDSPDNQLLVQFYLEGSPHSLTSVEHGGEAVDRVASQEFDVVLMDLQMPVMDGLTATRTIRARERESGSRAVPILALSANARRQDVETSLAAGCNAHLSKPITKRRLLAALDEYTKSPVEPEYF